MVLFCPQQIHVYYCRVWWIFALQFAQQRPWSSIIKTLNLEIDENTTDMKKLPFLCLSVSLCLSLLLYPSVCLSVNIYHSILYNHCQSISFALVLPSVYFSRSDSLFLSSWQWAPWQSISFLLVHPFSFSQRLSFILLFLFLCWFECQSKKLSVYFLLKFRDKSSSSL